MGTGEAAAYLEITRQRLDELAEAGRIPRRKVGRNYIYRRADLEAFKAAPKSKGGRPKGSGRRADVDTAASEKGDRHE